MNSEDIVHTIIAQIGGRDFAAKTMLKMPVRYSDDTERAEVMVYFDIAVPNEHGINMVEVVYMFGSDTYRMRFWSSHGEDQTLKAMRDEVYCDQLVQFVNEQLSAGVELVLFGDFE